MSAKIPHVLMILDGVGYRTERKDNAVAAANTPVLDELFATRPFGLISLTAWMLGCLRGSLAIRRLGT